MSDFLREKKRQLLEIIENGFQVKVIDYDTYFKGNNEYWYPAGEAFMTEKALFEKGKPSKLLKKWENI